MHPPMYRLLKLVLVLFWIHGEWLSSSTLPIIFDLIWHLHHYKKAVRLDTRFSTSYSISWSTMSGSASMFLLNTRLAFVLNYRIKLRGSHSLLESAMTGFWTQVLTAASRALYWWYITLMLNIFYYVTGRALYGLVTIGTWLLDPLMADFRCEYKVFSLVLVQNRNRCHYEVEHWDWPAHM